MGNSNINSKLNMDNKIIDETIYMFLKTLQADYIRKLESDKIVYDCKYYDKGLYIKFTIIVKDKSINPIKLFGNSVLYNILIKDNINKYITSYIHKREYEILSTCPNKIIDSYSEDNILDGYESNNTKLIYKLSTALFQSNYKVINDDINKLIDFIVECNNHADPILTNALILLYDIIVKVRNNINMLMEHMKDKILKKDYNFDDLVLYHRIIETINKRQNKILDTMNELSKWYEVVGSYYLNIGMYTEKIISLF
jgi:hypothetical protein